MPRRILRIALGIERVLQFTRRVAEEFERIAADNRADHNSLVVGSESVAVDELRELEEPVLVFRVSNE
jgi:hypothetical protein